jgi:signal transduction histidine kinase
MSFPLNTIMVLVNGTTLALALGFLLLLLWQNAKKEQNQFFASFLLLVMLWNLGSLLLQGSILTGNNVALASLALSMIELGFTGSSIAIYILTTILIGVHSRRFRRLAFASLFLIVGYRIFLIMGQAQVPASAADSVLAYSFQPLFILFYLTFDGLTLLLLWRYRRKIRSRMLVLGIAVFLLGQSLIFVNPALPITSFSTIVSAFGALIMCFAIVQQEIITPLSERTSQIESMHRVSLAISSQIGIDTVLNEIAVQAAGWLNADGVGIFLVRADAHTGDRLLALETVYGLPPQYLGAEILIGRGVAGTAAEKQQTIFLENYNRDWHEEDDLPVARETFGSVICAPMLYAGNIIGVLLVIASQQGHLLNLHDVYLLELLSAQAAVAIAHSQLFAEQQQLNNQVEAAHSQLETVLSSTDNPVIAIDRHFRLIFANPAARNLFAVDHDQSIIPHVPRSAFPHDYRTALRDIRCKGGHVYEVAVDDKVFLCHLATLRTGDADGWVAVLNDVTQLKELDRMKSEMVRMASHDLKNPLMGAMAYLDLLRDDLKDIEYQAADETINTIEWQLERMNRLIRGILDIERLRTVSAYLEVCSPREIVDAAIAEMAHQLQVRQIDLCVTIEESVPGFWADKEQFERAIVNLVENAIKFSPGSAGIHVQVYTDGRQVVFCVRDNGVGIPADIQPRIFDRFFRGQQQGVEHVTGSGLGLSLVKTIVENHNGKIWFESEQKIGTTFFVSVPAAEHVMLEPNASQMA